MKSYMLDPIPNKTQSMTKGAIPTGGDKLPPSLTASLVCVRKIKANSEQFTKFLKNKTQFLHEHHQNERRDELLEKAIQVGNVVQPEKNRG